MAPQETFHPYFNNGLDFATHFSLECSRNFIMRILPPLVAVLMTLLSASACAGQDFVKLKSTYYGSPGEKQPEQKKMLGTAQPSSHAYPGETKQFTLEDTATYYALKWHSLTPVVATVIDDQGGVVEFHQVGAAVFKIEVFDKKKELPTFVFAIVDCRAASLTLSCPAQLDLLVGEVIEIAPTLQKKGSAAPVLPRFISLNVVEANQMQLSDDNGKTWKSSAKVSPNTVVKVKALAAGKPRLQVLSSGLSETLEFQIVRPQVELRTTDSREEFVQGSTIEISSTVKMANRADLEARVRVEGASVHSSSTSKSTFITLGTQGRVKLTATVVKVNGKDVVPVDSDPSVLEFDVAPKCEFIAVNTVRRVILNGDRIKINITAFDANKQPISRARRGTLKASLLEFDRDKKTWVNTSGVTAIVTATEDFLKFERLRTTRRYKLVLELEAPTGTTHTEIEDLQFLEDVDVVARLVNDSSNRGPSDLFGPQVAREFNVFELTATNNRGLAEDPEIAKASTVHLYGATLRLPSLIAHKGRGIPLMSDSWQTQTDFEESTETEIAEFTRGNVGQIRMFLSPYYAEKFDKVKDAVNYRDPVNAVQRFIDTAMKVATFLQTAYPNAGSQPFKNANDITRLEQAKVVTDFVFNEYKNELSKKGKVTSSEVLREITKVAKDQPTVVYFLVRKDTWRRINGTDLDVTVFPVGSVKISYAVVSETNSTKAPGT